MPVGKDYQAYVEELLAPLGPVAAKRMFGGVGIFYDERMFALIADDVLYFKVDDSNRAAFQAAGSGPFEYETRNGTRGVMAYWRVPDEVLENEDEIVAWGRQAIDVALAAAKAKQPKGRRSGR